MNGHLNNVRFSNRDVAEVFESYPVNVREKLLFLRTLIFDIAAKTTEVGILEETLRWGEPSYLTTQTKSGSTIRLGWKNSQPDQYAIYFNCKTTLVDTFRQIFGAIFKYGGNRSLLFHVDEKIPVAELKHCISLALTYHLTKKGMHV